VDHIRFDNFEMIGDEAEDDGEEDGEEDLRSFIVGLDAGDYEDENDSGRGGEKKSNGTRTFQRLRNDHPSYLREGVPDGVVEDPPQKRKNPTTNASTPSDLRKRHKCEVCDYKAKTSLESNKHRGRAHTLYRAISIQSSNIAKEPKDLPQNKVVRWFKPGGQSDHH